MTRLLNTSKKTLLNQDSSTPFLNCTNKVILVAPLSPATVIPQVCISQFVNFHLQPLVTKLSSYIKDTTHYLNKLNTIGPLPDGVLLVTLDVSSLYTKIPHKDGIQACSDFLNRRVNPTIQTNRLCDLIRMILTNNTFTFN